MDLRLMKKPQISHKDGSFDGAGDEDFYRAKEESFYACSKANETMQ